MMADEVTLHSFSGLTGAHQGRVAFSAASWSDSVNEEGSMAVTLPADSPGAGRCRPWRDIVAAVRGKRVLHAGYVTHVKEDAGVMSVDCGGGASILAKRIVLNRALRSSWKDGTVLVDEDHPAGDWPLTIRGSYSDLVRGLIVETTQWGALPFRVAAFEGGQHERNYNSYDFATVLSRIWDIGDLADGPEIRFDPELQADGSLLFLQRTADEIRDNWWKWNADVPGSPVVVGAIDCDGADMAGQCFASGGKSDDRLLVAMARSSNLESLGWPLLQAADTSHSSVSDIATLRSYAAGAASSGDATQDCVALRMRADVPVAVGDWADVRHNGELLQLKVTDVSGNADGSPTTAQCRFRGQS